MISFLCITREKLTILTPYIMAYTIKTLAELVVVEITLEQVIDHPMKEYNAQEWKKTAMRYSDAKFFLHVDKSGRDRIYVQHIGDGIRFLSEMSYCSSLTSGTFSWGYVGHDSIIHVMQYEEGRMGTDNKARAEMRKGTQENSIRFFTKLF